MQADTQTAIESAYQLVRVADHDRYLACLLAPAAKRDALMALYAFNSEIARVAEVVSEPMLGEIRLQWWRDELDKIAKGDNPSGHEVAIAIAGVNQLGAFPFATCQQLIDARARDLSDEPFSNVAALEDYVRGTSALLMRAAGEILCGADIVRSASNLIDEAGLAYGLTGLLRALPHHASQGRIDLPLDLMGRHEIDPHDVLSGKMTPALRTGINEMIELARKHLAAARREPLPREALSALLPASLCDAYLDILSARNFDPFTVPCEVAGFRRQLRLVARLWRGKI